MRAVEMLVGGCVVYVGVAACSSPAVQREMREVLADAGVPWVDTDAGTADSSPVPDAAADEAATSGSRLKVIHLLADDGYTEARGIQDTQLNVQCGFRAYTDSTLRCTPYPAVGVELAFADSGCVTRTPILTSGPPTLYPYEWLGGLNGQSGVAPVGAQYVGAVYSGDPTNCRMVSGPFWTVGAEMPPSAFVAAHTQVGP
jgi:hypothetical protein